MNKFKINVETSFPVAFESPDHLIPWGTARDNSKNYRFNQKINKLFDGVKKPIKTLDLGCSGGGFIADCINDGHIGVGLEGSDYSLNIGRAEWSRIPNNLFTCDITKDFSIKLTYNEIQELCKFDIITSWEIMEHIKTEDLEQVANNVNKHLSDNGLWVMSVSSMDDFINGVNLHQTVQPRDWWINKFHGLGFYHQEKLHNFFNGQYIRSDKYGAPSSFNLILSKNKEFNLNIPKLTFTEKAFDFWIGSRIQKNLMKIVNGPNSYS